MSENSTCSGTVRSGDRKGEICGNPIKYNGYCGIHKNLGIKSEPVLPTKRVSPKTEKTEKTEKKSNEKTEKKSNEKTEKKSNEKTRKNSNEKTEKKSNEKKSNEKNSNEKTENVIPPLPEISNSVKKINEAIREYVHPIPSIDKEHECAEIVQALLKIPQPEQRSEQWYAMRNDRITASDAASCLVVTKEDFEREKKGYLIVKGKIGRCANPYKSKKEFILNKCIESEFKGNPATRWGQKYENVANQIYERRHNVKVLEFGLLPHPTIDWLGASPDGITKNGIMLEIKCPYSDRDLGPPFHYYWVQIQLQLETCRLDYCDFLECKIIEYRSEKAYYNDGGTTGRTKCGLEKGILLKVCHEVEGESDPKSFYVYPILGTDEEVRKWINNWILEDMKNHTLEYFTKKRYGELHYWKLERCSCIRIKREPDWFKANIPNFRAAWDQVLLCRENKEELDKLLESKKPKKFINIDDNDGNEKSMQTASTSLFKGCMITNDDD